MNVRYHRIAAVTILLAGVVVLLAWGRSMAIDSDEIRVDRDKLQGKWVATFVQTEDNLKLEGDSAGVCQAEFDGKNVIFHHLINGIDARGTVYLEKPNRVDFRLDAGWIIGIYEFDGETLKLSLNPFASTERLGVPTRPRPRQLKPGETHHFYVFRRARP
jgi:hypothetical protein